MENKSDNILNILKIVISIIITVVFIFGICKVIKWDNEQEFKYNTELIP